MNFKYYPLKDVMVHLSGTVDLPESLDGLVIVGELTKDGILIGWCTLKLEQTLEVHEGTKNG